MGTYVFYVTILSVIALYSIFSGETPVELEKDANGNQGNWESGRRPGTCEGRYSKTEDLQEHPDSEQKQGWQKKEEVMAIHTIPVPKGWSIEQAWEAISRGDTLPTTEQSWANVEVDENEKLVHIFDPDDK